LVELQRNLPDFERNNIAAFGISYDPVDVLARFAAAHGVTFPLLSDEAARSSGSWGCSTNRCTSIRMFRQVFADRDQPLVHVHHLRRRGVAVPTRRTPVGSPT
jgi:peroxiredoxin